MLRATRSRNLGYRGRRNGNDRERFDRFKKEVRAAKTTIESSVRKKNDDE